MPPVGLRCCDLCQPSDRQRQDDKHQEGLRERSQIDGPHEVVVEEEPQAQRE